MENIVMLLMYLPQNVNTLCKCFFCLRQITVDFFVVVIHSHKDRFIQIFSPIKQSTIWGSDLHIEMKSTKQGASQQYKLIAWCFMYFFSRQDNGDDFSLGWLLYPLSIYCHAFLCKEKFTKNCFLN